MPYSVPDADPTFMDCMGYEINEGDRVKVYEVNDISNTAYDTGTVIETEYDAAIDEGGTWQDCGFIRIALDNHLPRLYVSRDGYSEDFEIVKEVCDSGEHEFVMGPGRSMCVKCGRVA